MWVDGELAIDAVLALVECLKDEDSDVRDSAALELGKLGEHAKDAAAALTKCLKDRNSDVRDSAATAPLLCGGQTVWTPLVQQTKAVSYTQQTQPTNREH